MSIQTLKVKLEDALQRLKNEIASLRTGRASAALVENIDVDYYGAKTPVKALAAISVPDARQIVIQPWDKAALQPIEKAIRDSSLGLSPVVDKEVIRLNIPSLTEERRKDLVKLLGRYLEEVRIQVRKDRDEALKEVEKREKAKEISEDEKFRQKSEVQKMIDEINKKIEEIGMAKENEVMAV